MSDPVEIELVDIDSITSSGAKFWGRVKVLELWPDGDGYIYNAGTHEDEWAKGRDESPGSAETTNTKLAEQLYLKALGAWDWGESLQAYILRAAEIAWATDEKVDLAGIDKVKVNWAATLDPSDTKEGENYTSDRKVMLIASTDQTASGIVTYTVRYMAEETGFSARDNEIDVSGLNGEYYIRIHAYAKPSDDSEDLSTHTEEIELWINKVWLEEAEE